MAGECGQARTRAAAKATLAAALVAGGWNVGATELFKCGSTFQDRPCASAPVQQRFSRTHGEFSIEQVRPTTDKDCADAARHAMPWWNRLAAGERVESLNAEIQAQNISRLEKSRMRDVLNVMRSYRGNPVEVRGEFEAQCMAYKRVHGVPTERQVALGAATLANEGPPPTATERRGYRHSAVTAWQAEQRAGAEAWRAEERARVAGRRAGP